MTTLRIGTPGRLGAALAAFVMVLATPLAWAQARNAVESVNFSSVQGGKIIVKKSGCAKRSPPCRRDSP
jgi:hypothetical protein